MPGVTAAFGARTPLACTPGETAMNMTAIVRTAILCSAASALAGCSTIKSLFDRESKISLEDVPANVRSAAEFAVPGFVLESAEIEKSGRVHEYELQGRANDRDYEIHVGPSGDVTMVKFEIPPEPDGPGS